jgi:hypothetical protein
MVSVRRDYNTTVTADGGLTDEIEQFYGRIENEASKGFQSVIDNEHWPITPLTRGRIAAWMALQILRTPASRAMLNELAQVDVLEMILSRGKCGLREALEATGDIEGLQDLDDLWDFMSDPDSFAVDVGANAHAQLVLAELRGTTNLLLWRRWDLVRLESAALLTCDEPIGLVASEFGGGTGLSSEVYVSLGRRTGLHLGELLDPATGLEGLNSQDRLVTRFDGVANLFNEAARRNARREIYSHPSDSDLVDVPLQPPRDLEISGLNQVVHMMQTSFSMLTQHDGSEHA